MSCFVSAANQLLSCGYVQFGDCRLPVTNVERTVVVTGISRSAPTTLLKTLLESAHVNGGKVDDIIHEQGQESAIVTFQSSEGILFF